MVAELSVLGLETQMIYVSMMMRCKKGTNLGFAWFEMTAWKEYVKSPNWKPNQLRTFFWRKHEELAIHVTFYHLCSFHYQISSAYARAMYGGSLTLSQSLVLWIAIETDPGVMKSPPLPNDNLNSQEELNDCDCAVILGGHWIQQWLRKNAVVGVFSASSRAGFKMRYISASLPDKCCIVHETPHFPS